MVQVRAARLEVRTNAEALEAGASERGGQTVTLPDLTDGGRERNPMRKSVLHMDETEEPVYSHYLIPVSYPWRGTALHVIIISHSHISTYEARIENDREDPKTDGGEYQAALQENKSKGLW